MFDNKSVLLSSLTKGFLAKAMKLLVTMSTLLMPSDYQRLGPHLWEQALSTSDSSSTASVRIPLKPFRYILSFCLLVIGVFSYNAMC